MFKLMKKKENLPLLEVKLKLSVSRSYDVPSRSNTDFEEIESKNK